MKFIRPGRCLQLYGKKYTLILSHEPDSPLFKREHIDRQLPCPPIHRFWVDPRNRLQLRMFLKNEFQVDCSRLSDHNAIQLISNYLTRRRFFIVPVKPFEPQREIIPHEPKPSTVIESYKDVLSWIKIEMVDEEGNPVPGVAYQVTRPTGGVVGRGTLDGNGFARVDEIEPGECKVTFPELDKEIWNVKEGAVGSANITKKEKIAKYKVKQGNCLVTIAAELGFLPGKIWNDARNKDLKEKRKNSNVLFEGDELFIPDREIKEVSCSTGQQYIFGLKKIMPMIIKLCLQEDGEPLAGEKYTLIVGEKIIKGKTNSEGIFVEENLPASITQATLEVCGRKTILKLGYLDPVCKISGVKARLRNLGYYAGSLDSKINSNMEHALVKFQKKEGLDVTREPDTKTQDKLIERHGN